MKIILPVLCSLLLIGCSDSTPDQTPPSPTTVAAVAEPNSSLPVQEASAAETIPAVSLPKKRQLLHRLLNKQLFLQPLMGEHYLAKNALRVME